LRKKSLSLTESVAMSPLVGDEELQNILNKDSNYCKDHIRIYIEPIFNIKAMHCRVEFNVLPMKKSQTYLCLA
jgi:hypothetical protein